MPPAPTALPTPATTSASRSPPAPSKKAWARSSGATVLGRRGETRALFFAAFRRARMFRKPLRVIILIDRVCSQRERPLNDIGFLGKEFTPIQLKECGRDQKPRALISI